MLFVGAGVLAYATGILEPTRVVGSPIVAILELTLALLLFRDASRVHIMSWEADARLPTRLLTIGMPLTLVAGTAAAYVVFPNVGIIAAGAIATILAPTGAALGRAVISNPRVPIRIREAIGIESGLNDGIALPILLFLISLAEAEHGTRLWHLFVRGIGVGVGVGVALGAIAAIALRFAHRRSWIRRSWLQIAVVAIAFATFLATDLLGGSGFIGAYVAGHTFGRVIGEIETEVHGFGESLGSGLMLVSFLIFGGYMLGPNTDLFATSTVICAVLSLTVVRMIPVAIAMIRTGLQLPTVAYLGWFGPRGLASIIFGAVLIEEIGIEHLETATAAVVVTVTFSVVAHGATAPWAASRYADWAQLH